MVLIPCPACAREISSDARSCPGCGHPCGRTGVNWAKAKRIGAATLASVLAIVQVAAQSAQDQLGLLVLALVTVGVGIAIVKGVSHLRGSLLSPRTVGLTIILAPTLVFFVMGPHYASVGIGFGIATWIIYALFRVALKRSSASDKASLVAR